MGYRAQDGESASGSRALKWQAAEHDNFQLDEVAVKQCCIQNAARQSTDTSWRKHEGAQVTHDEIRLKLSLCVLLLRIPPLPDVSQVGVTRGGLDGTDGTREGRDSLPGRYWDSRKEEQATTVV